VEAKLKSPVAVIFTMINEALPILLSVTDCIRSNCLLAGRKCDLETRLSLPARRTAGGGGHKRPTRSVCRHTLCRSRLSGLEIWLRDPPGLACRTVRSNRAFATHSWRYGIKNSWLRAGTLIVDLDVPCSTQCRLQCHPRDGWSASYRERFELCATGVGESWPPDNYTFKVIALAEVRSNS